MAAGAAAAIHAQHAAQAALKNPEGKSQAELLAEKAALFGLSADADKKVERTMTQKFCSENFDCCNDPDDETPRPDWDPQDGCGRSCKAIGNLCDRVIESNIWKIFGLLVIIACAVNVGLQTDSAYACTGSHEAKDIEIFSSQDDWTYTKVRDFRLSATKGLVPNPKQNISIAADAQAARYWRIQLKTFQEDGDFGGLMRVGIKGPTATSRNTSWPYTARASSCLSNGRCASNLGKLRKPWSTDFNKDHPDDWLTKLGERKDATVTFDMGTPRKVALFEVWNHNEDTCTQGGAICAAVDAFILWYFTVELFIVLAKYKNKPCFFWSDPWNTFDFVVVVACHMPFGGSSTGVLRLLRLLRVLKLLKRLKQLQVIVNGLIMGVKEIVYLFLLMIIVFYFFAVIALLFLKDNDPRHFGDMFICFVTLFRLATMDGWAAVLYISMFGCDHFGYDDGECTNGVNGMNPDNFSPGGITKWNGTPGPEEAIAIFFFISFVVIAALVLLSMFIGIVTTSMFTARQEYEQEAEAEQADKDKEAAERRLNKLMQSDEMKNTIRAISGEKLSAEEMGMVADTNTGFWALYIPLCDVMYKVSRHSVFNTTMLLIILLASVLVGLSAGGYAEVEDELMHRIKDADGNVKMDETLDGIITSLNKFVLYAFTVEIFVKVMAARKKPWKYFYEGWNVFDFLVVVGCYLPIQGAQSILQLLRLLRVLKIVRSVKQLHVIVQGLMKGMGAIGYIAILLFLVYYLFAVVAMILFKDNDPFHFGTLALSILTLFRISTLDTWTDIMYINMYGCHRYYYHDSDPAEVPAGVDPNRHMHVGMGFSYWYGRQWTCDRDKVTIHTYLTPLFFLLFITIATFMMLSLFIGVITTSMNEATMEQKKFMEIDAKIKACQDMFGLRDDQVANYRTLFSAIDADGGGALDMDELRNALRLIFPDQTEEELQAFIAKVDRDGGGEVDEAEFVEAIIFSVMCPSSDDPQEESHPHGDFAVFDKHNAEVVGHQGHHDDHEMPAEGNAQHTGVEASEEIGTGDAPPKESAEEIAAREEKARAIEEAVAENVRLKEQLDAIKQKAALQMKEQQRQQQIEEMTMQPMSGMAPTQYQMGTDRPMYSSNPAQQSRLHQPIGQAYALMFGIHNAFDWRIPFRRPPKAGGFLQRKQVSPLVTCPSCGMQVLASVPVCYHCGSATPTNHLPQQPNVAIPNTQFRAADPLTMSAPPSDQPLRQADLSAAVTQRPVATLHSSAAAAERAEIVRIARSSIGSTPLR